MEAGDHSSGVPSLEQLLALSAPDSPQGWGLESGLLRQRWPGPCTGDEVMGRQPRLAGEAEVKDILKLGQRCNGVSCWRPSREQWALPEVVPCSVRRQWLGRQAELCLAVTNSPALHASHGPTGLASLQIIRASDMFKVLCSCSPGRCTSLHSPARTWTAPGKAGGPTGAACILQTEALNSHRCRHLHNVTQLRWPSKDLNLSL